MLTIGEVASLAGIRPSAIRYYEEAELLPRPVRVSGWRRYEPGVLARLRLIRRAQEAGFTIAEIRTLLHGFPEETTPAQRWQALAGRKRAEVDAQIEQLLGTRNLLDLVLQCGCARLEDCAGNGE